MTEELSIPTTAEVKIGDTVAIYIARFERTWFEFITRQPKRKIMEKKLFTVTG